MYGCAAGQLQARQFAERGAKVSPRLDEVFGLDAERVCNPVDIVEVGNHLHRIMDGAVIKPGRTQRIQVCRQHFARGVRELGRKLAQCAVYECQGCSAPVSSHSVYVSIGLCCDCNFSDLSPEVVGMPLRSVVALIFK